MTKKTNSAAGRKRVVFEIEVDAGSEVSIAGSFNNWDPSQKKLEDKSNSGLFKCIMLLSPGIYEYKFIVNGDWCLDPNNPNFVPNSHGTLNSRIEVL